MPPRTRSVALALDAATDDINVDFDIQQQQQDFNMINASEETARLNESELTSEESMRGRPSARSASRIPANNTVQPSSTLETILELITTIIATQASRSNINDAVAAAMRNVRQSTMPSHDSYKEPKVNTPDTFNGEQNKLTNFLMQVNLGLQVTAAQVCNRHLEDLLRH